MIMNKMKGKLGFGCMRLPMLGGEVDKEQFSALADAFIAAGFNYFDTAHGYINGKSEIAIAECVSKRHKRNDFLLTDKLTSPYFNKQEDIRPFVEKQLTLCGVDHFDYYLMHAQDHNNYGKFNSCKAYETASGLKEEGLIRHLGISFHDRADVLDMILTEHPEVEIVQIQFNYIDYEDPSVESRKVYEVCEKHNKPVIVMEPVKGGSLVNLPEAADKTLRDLNGGSNAAYAIRFAASFPKMAMVLSGMSNMEQMMDNISAMKDFKPLDKSEMAAISKVCSILKSYDLIPCTACRYCVEQNKCPKSINIPEMFSAYNMYKAFHNWNTKMYYNTAVTAEGNGKASDCVRCGKCERACPQHLEICKFLIDVANMFENGAF